MFKNLIIATCAIVSSFISIMLIGNLTVDPDNYINISNKKYDINLSELELYWLLLSPDFWRKPFIEILTQSFNKGVLFNFYSGLSLLTFSTGLTIYNFYIRKISMEYAALLYILMGWLHIILSKIILIASIPAFLEGPVISVSCLSLFYFSLSSLLFATSKIILLVVRLGRFQQLQY